MNKKLRENVFKIINAGLSKEKISLDAFNEESLLFKCIKEQALQSYLYPVTGNVDYKKYYIASYLFHEHVFKVANKIKKVFDENNIKYVFLKGYHLMNLYVDPVLRMLGDIDLLVDKANYKEAIKLLEKEGFKKLPNAEHHQGMKIGNVEVEIHHHLTNYGEKLYDYLSDPFSHLISLDNKDADFEPTFNLIFIISHFLRHLKKGAGVRPFIDIYLLYKNCSIDLNHVREVMKEEGLELFYNTLLGAIKEMFNYEVEKNIESELHIELIDYCLNSGIHGYGENNNADVNHQINTSRNKFIYLLKKLFIPLPSLFSYYPWTKSIILIPFGYIYRFFDLLFRKNKKLKKVINSDNNQEKTIIEKLNVN